MYEDMNKMVNILLVIALVLLFSITLVVNISTFLAKIMFIAIVLCTLGALAITFLKVIGFVQDKE